MLIRTHIAHANLAGVAMLEGLNMWKLSLVVHLASRYLRELNCFDIAIAARVYIRSYSSTSFKDVLGNILH